MRNTLHLNLKKKWFDMILSGQKREEYRAITNYWCSMLVDFYCGRKLNDGNNMKYFMENIHSGNCVSDKLLWRGYDTITFSNGYSKDRPQFEIELNDIRVDQGIHEWGAETDEYYFVLSLGEVINNQS